MPSSPNNQLINKLYKPWEEAGIEDKVEKLKAELQEFQHLNSRIYQLEQEVANLKRHSHADGKVVIPVMPENGHGFGGVLGGQASRRSYIA